MVHSRDSGRKHIAARVVEINVDAFGGCRFQLLVDSARLVIEHFIEAEIVFHPGAFVRAARGADHAAARDLRDLARNGADGTRRTRHQNGFTGSRARHIQHSEIGGEASNAERAQKMFGLVPCCHVW